MVKVKRSAFNEFVYHIDVSKLYTIYYLKKENMPFYEIKNITYIIMKFYAKTLRCLIHYFLTYFQTIYEYFNISLM